MVASVIFVAQNQSLSLRLRLQVPTQALDPGSSQFPDIVSGDMESISEGVWWHLQLELRFFRSRQDLVPWIHFSAHFPESIWNVSGVQV